MPFLISNNNSTTSYHEHCHRTCPHPRHYFRPAILGYAYVKKYSLHQEHFPGTGGELAEHLIERYELNGIKVEKTDDGDHYDPTDKVVRLTPDKFDGKSLTAITVAAHEIGHAIQHRNGYPSFGLRQHVVSVAIVAEKIGAIAMIAIPFAPYN